MLCSFIFLLLPYIACGRRDCDISWSNYIVFVSVICEFCYVLLYSSWCHLLAVIDVIVVFPDHITLMFCL